MFSYVVAVVFWYVLMTLVFVVCTVLTAPLTQKRGFSKTTAGESLVQYSIFPALVFAAALFCGFIHHAMVGPGCRDLSQPVSVAPNSRAAALGIMSGDTIVKINGGAADCFGELRLADGATSATMIVKRSTENGGGQFSIALSGTDSLQSLFRNGLHLPILRHPLSWSEALRHSGDYIIPINQVIVAKLGLVNSDKRPISLLYPEESAIDFFMVLIFLSIYATYILPFYFLLRVLIGALLACASKHNPDASAQPVVVKLG